jgi:hypothetical protein
MSTTVGSSPQFSTWGKFRFLFCKNTLQVITNGLYSRTYIHGLKSSADGSGFLSKPPVGGIVFWNSSLAWGPTFRVEGETVYLLVMNIPYASEQLRADFEGNVITTDGGDVTINDAFWNNWQGALPAGSEPTTITSVEGLTAF